MTRQPAKIESIVRTEHYLVETPALICSKCDHIAVEGDDMPEYMRRTADAYRRAHGLLTSMQIQDRRRALDMNQREFAAHLGVGDASIKRWELGQIQDAAMNELILLKTDPAAARRNLVEVTFRLGTAGRQQETYGALNLRPQQIYTTAPAEPESGDPRQQECKADFGETAGAA